MNEKDVANTALKEHLNMLKSFSKKELSKNPMLLYVVNEGIKNLSLALAFIEKL